MFKSLKHKLILLIFALALFSVIPACSQQDSSVAPSTHNVVAGDFAPRQLRAHFLKHKEEFDYKTEKEYLNGARRILDSVKTKEILEKIQPDGDILHYNIRTGEFAVMTDQGRIKTYFKANYQYWMRQ